MYLDFSLEANNKFLSMQSEYNIASYPDLYTCRHHLEPIFNDFLN